MARFITVGAAQMGPVGTGESRSQVVGRLLELMREAKARGCDLVVFTECALTPFFPRFWEDDLTAVDRWFEREMPGPDTELLFSEAHKLGIGFHLGFAELAEEDGRPRRFNSSLLAGPDGNLIGKYRKIHLPGQTKKDDENPHRCYEKRYFEIGDLGFRAWNAFGGAIGMCLGNDRRWPESYRVLALQGAEMILVGYNTVSDHPDHPELDHLTNFHSLLSMQAGAYQNGCFVVGVAKAGNEEGIQQIGRSAIIGPSGEVLTQCTTLGDELIVHRCNLDQTRLYKEQLFNFAENRRIEAYSLITQTRGPVSPSEPESPPEPTTPDQATAGEPRPESIEQLFTEHYGYSNDRAKELADKAEFAQGLSALSAPPKTQPKSDTTAVKDKRSRELPADPIEAIEKLFREEYGYSPEQIEPIAKAALCAKELVESQEAEVKADSPAKPQKQKTPVSAILAKARAEAKQPELPETKAVVLPVAEDIGWMPGKFSRETNGGPDKAVEVVMRLTKDYRFPDDKAKEIAVRAEAAWRLMHGEEPVSEPPPTAAYVPGEEAIPKPPEKPLTKDAGADASEKTTPSLSGQEALATYSHFTEKYGYDASTARGIAERAYSAWQRWQSTNAQEKPEPASKKPAAPIATPTPAPEPAGTLKEGKLATEQADPEFVVVHCPECDFPLKLNQENFGLLGRKARCPQCQTKFRLPESV